MDSLPPATSSAPIWSSRLPGWALSRGRDMTEADAAFAAGIALKSLDDLVRSDPAWAGCWCSRQALKCAAAAVRLSRDVIASLRSAGFIASGPRSPTPGAPYTYVTTKHFLSAFGMETLRDLPDIEALDDAGLLDARIPLGNGYAEESPDEDE